MIMLSCKSWRKQQLPAPHHRIKRTYDPLTLKMKIVKSDKNWAYNIRCALLPRKATLKSAISMLTWTKRQQSLAARIPLSSFRRQFLHHTCLSIMIHLRATFSREAIICRPSCQAWRVDGPSAKTCSTRCRLKIAIKMILASTVDSLMLTERSFSCRQAEFSHHHESVNENQSPIRLLFTPKNSIQFSSKIQI